MAAHTAVSAPIAPLRSMVPGAVWPVPQPEESDADAFRAPGTVQHFVQDRQIFADGDPADHFYRVVSGVVRACKFLNDGRRQIEAFHVAGDVFGLEAGLTYSISAEAVSDSTVVAFRHKAAMALAQKDLALSSQLMTAVTRALSHARSHALLLGRRGVPARAGPGADPAAHRYRLAGHRPAVCVHHVADGGARPGSSGGPEEQGHAAHAELGVLSHHLLRGQLLPGEPHRRFEDRPIRLEWRHELLLPVLLLAVLGNYCEHLFDQGCSPAHA